MYALIAIVACLGLADPPTHELTLASGETLRGMLVEQTADRIVFEHPILGRLELGPDAVVDIIVLTQPPDEPAPPAEPPAQSDALPVPDLPRWDSRFDLGFTGSAGVTEEANIRLAIRSKHETPTHTYRVDASYLGKSTNGDVTDNSFTAGILADWPLADSRWGYFGQARYDFDEFQSWKHRISVGGGLAYQLVDIDHPDGGRLLGLKLRGGLGALKEFGSIDEQLEPEGIIGIDLSWHVRKNQTFMGAATAFPNLSDFDDARVVAKVEYSIRFDTLDGLSLNAGIDYEWQSITDPGIPPNDFKMYVSLGLGF